MQTPKIPEPTSKNPEPTSATSKIPRTSQIPSSDIKSLPNSTNTENDQDLDLVYMAILGSAIFGLLIVLLVLVFLCIRLRKAENTIQKLEKLNRRMFSLDDEGQGLGVSNEVNTTDETTPETSPETRALVHTQDPAPGTSGATGGPEDPNDLKPKDLTHSMPKDSELKTEPEIATHAIEPKVTTQARTIRTRSMDRLDEIDDGPQYSTGKFKAKKK